MIERTCRLSGERFLIEREDLEFYAKMGVISDEQLEALKNFCLPELDSGSKNFEIPDHPKGTSIFIPTKSVKNLGAARKDNVVEIEKIPAELLVGLPTLCPLERMRRRLSFRNERVLYFRKCDITEEKIISILSGNLSVSQQMDRRRN